ncbi:hypothetical protein LJC45_04915 [Alistipes sp. OttesenSCG-928-B03]|nr:hypothetical protein [Alistipes sp. OttesenSCG-928-B03]
MMDDAAAITHLAELRKLYAVLMEQGYESIIFHGLDWSSYYAAGYFQSLKPVLGDSFILCVVKDRESITDEGVPVSAFDHIESLEDEDMYFDQTEFYRYLLERSGLLALLYPKENPASEELEIVAKTTGCKVMTIP